MRFGENALETIDRVKAKLAELGLASRGRRDRPRLRPRPLIERAVDNLREKLLQQCLIVALVCFVFLVHFAARSSRSSLLPLGILFSFIVMYHQGINANIMSLGGIAIAIGTMIDAGIVMVENAHKHLERDGGRPKPARDPDRCRPSRSALPLLLAADHHRLLPAGLRPRGPGGRLFKPLAFTKTYAMAAPRCSPSRWCPALMICPRARQDRPEARNPLNRADALGLPPGAARSRCASRSLVIVGIAARCCSRRRLYPWSARLGVHAAPRRGGPALHADDAAGHLDHEGARDPAADGSHHRELPEVERVFGKIGRAETATDPAPLSMIETTITLKAPSEWRAGHDDEKLIASSTRHDSLPGPDQRLDDADQDAHRHALDRHQDAPSASRSRGPTSPSPARTSASRSRRRCATVPGHAERVRRAWSSAGTTSTSRSTATRSPATASPSGRPGRHPDGDRRHEHQPDRRRARALPHQSALQPRASRRHRLAAARTGAHAGAAPRCPSSSSRTSSSARARRRSRPRMHAPTPGSTSTSKGSTSAPTWHERVAKQVIEEHVEPARRLHPQAVERPVRVPRAGRGASAAHHPDHAGIIFLLLY